MTNLTCLPEIEEAVLGGLLLAGIEKDKDVLVKILEDLPAEAFMEERTKTVFRTIYRVFEKGQMPDLVTVTAAVGSELGVGGASYISDLPNRIASYQLIDQYVDQLRDRSRRRDVKGIALKLQHAADKEDDIDTLLGSAIKDLNRATRPREPSRPEPKWEGGRGIFLWHRDGIGIAVDRIREHSDDLRAEITVTAKVGNTLGLDRINLLTTRGRGDFAKVLKEHRSDVDWLPRLEWVCQRAVEKYRQGEPAELLVPVSTLRDDEYHIDPVLPLYQTSVGYADGGNGKSLFALALAISTATGKVLPGGIKPIRTCPVEYLDYEGEYVQQGKRLGGLLRGFGLPFESVPIHYRRMTGALADHEETLRSEIARLGVGFVIVDSLVPACGPEPKEAGSVSRVFDTLRSFRTTNLIIAHVPKTQADQTSNATRPWGSAFVWNFARSVWEIVRAKEADDDRMEIALYHRKANDSRLHPAIGLRFEFTGNAITIHSGDVTEHADLSGRLSLSTRILHALAKGKQSVSELSEVTGAQENQIRARLGSLRSQGKVVPFPSTQGVRSPDWGLAALR
jgi:hypothetical protein